MERDELLNAMTWIKKNANTVDGEAHILFGWIVKLALDGYLNNDEDKIDSAALSCILITKLGLEPSIEYIDLIFKSTIECHPMMIGKKLDDPTKFCKIMAKHMTDWRIYLNEHANECFTLIKSDFEEGERNDSNANV